jgi:hypothetical protein
MKKYLCAALGAAVLIAAAPASASAASFLPMWQGKHEVRKNLHKLASGVDGYGYIDSCWRNSRSRITCDTVIEIVEGTCETMLGARKSYGVVYGTFPGDVDCY